MSPDERTAGLCAHCRYARSVRTVRGSQFLRCLRADADPGFSRYPRLPMPECRGYEPAAATVTEAVAPRDRLRNG